MFQASLCNLVSQRRTSHYHTAPTRSSSLSSIGTPEVTQLVANITGLYAPELTIGYSSVCLRIRKSDVLTETAVHRHVVATISRSGPKVSLHPKSSSARAPSRIPCTIIAVSLIRSALKIHLIRPPGDLSERVGYDMEQARSIAKVQVCHSPCSG